MTIDMVLLNFRGLEPNFLYTKLELLCMVKTILQRAQLEQISLEFELVRDGDMAALNFEHFGTYSPTNILSFPNLDKAEVKNSEHTFLGSLVLSVDTLKREAKLYNLTQEEHLFNLLTHGFAHLCGYEHSLEMDDFCWRLKNLELENEI